MDVPLPLIVTGGQTGIDLAATDAAIAAKIDWSGIVPRGRVNEAGRIPDRYAAFQEGPSHDPIVRTRANVDRSDAVLVLTDGSASPGTDAAVQYARDTAKPVCVITIDRDAVSRIVEFVAMEGPEILNVAGPRFSELGDGDPIVADTVTKSAQEVLTDAFLELRARS